MVKVVIINNTSRDMMDVGINEDLIQKFCTCTTGIVSFANDGVEKRYHKLPELNLPVYEIMDDEGFKYLLVPYKVVSDKYEVQYFTTSWCSNVNTVFDKGINNSLCGDEEFSFECLQTVLSNAEEHNIDVSEFEELKDAVNAHNTMMTQTFKA